MTSTNTISSENDCRWLPSKKAASNDAYARRRASCGHSPRIDSKRRATARCDHEDGVSKSVQGVSGMSLEVLAMRPLLFRQYGIGVCARPAIDEILNQKESCAVIDLIRMFELSDITSLLALREAIDENRLVPRVYWSEHSQQGCIAGILLGFRSTYDCVYYDYPNDESFFAVNRAIRAFDYFQLSVPDVRRSLDGFMARVSTQTVDSFCA